MKKKKKKIKNEDEDQRGKRNQELGNDTRAERWRTFESMGDFLLNYSSAEGRGSVGLVLIQHATENSYSSTSILFARQCVN